MTPSQLALIRALSHVRLPLGPRADKRFLVSLRHLAEHAPETLLSPRQGAFLLRLVHRYRRQLPTAICVLALDEAERLADLHPEGAASHRRSVVKTRDRLRSEPRVVQLCLPLTVAGTAGGGRGAPTPQAARGSLA